MSARIDYFVANPQVISSRIDSRRDQVVCKQTGYIFIYRCGIPNTIRDELYQNNNWNSQSKKRYFANFRCTNSPHNPETNKCRKTELVLIRIAFGLPEFE